MNTETEDFEKLRSVILREKKIVAEITSLGNYMKNADVGEQRIIDSQIDIMEQTLRKSNEEIPGILDKIMSNQRPILNVPGKDERSLIASKTTVAQPSTTPANPDLRAKTPVKALPEPVKVNTIPKEPGKVYTLKELKPVGIEKITLKRMKKKDKKTDAVKERKPSEYLKFANKVFSKTAGKMLNEKTMDQLERDLIKANLQFTPRSYLSFTMLTTCVAFLIGIVIAIFFFFFNITSNLPFIVMNTGALSTRLLVSVLIILLVPVLTFVIMYMYPNTEKSSAGNRIDEELPFATIHMSAISGSMIDPSKIFDIIITTHEYPLLEREFKKIINEINLYGYDLVSALRNSAYNTPSRKLSELLNGLATTINSGGYLPEFFDKRSQTLLFENRLEQEKKNKGAETFMDIYISLVIAAPMILMILLMMMKISGLGISMSTQMITIIMVVAVTMINLMFLAFLQLKK